MKGNLSLFSGFDCFFFVFVFFLYCIVQHWLSAYSDIILKVCPFVFQIRALALDPTQSRRDPVQPATHLAVAVTVRGSETMMTKKARRQENPA